MKFRNVNSFLLLYLYVYQIITVKCYECMNRKWFVVKCKTPSETGFKETY